MNWLTDMGAMRASGADSRTPRADRIRTKHAAAARAWQEGFDAGLAHDADAPQPRNPYDV